MALALVLLAAPASASAGTASISGVVTAADTDAPLAHARVVVSKPDGPATNDASTDAEGKYTIGGLDAGDYRVAFYPPQGANFIPQIYGDYDEGDPEPISLGDGQAVTWANASLVPGSTISGRVTEKSGGAAAPRVCVAVLKFDDRTSSIVTVGGATTDAAGNYSISALGSGYYKMWFGPLEGTFGQCAGGARNSGYVAQWLDGKPDFFTSVPINLGYKKERTGVDAQLGRAAGSSAGTETGSGTPTTGQGARCIVPKLRGLTPKPAAKALKRAHCRAGKTTRRTHAKVKRGRVIGTTPKAGSSLPAGARVALVVSKGPAPRR